MDDFSRQVLDALPLTIYTTDLEGRITSTNRSWSRFAADNGAPELVVETQVCGSSLWSAFAEPGYATQVRDAMAQLRSGSVQRVAWEFPCSSPTEERVFLLQVTMLRDEVQQPKGFVFSTVDITPSHKSREALINTGLALARPVDLERVFHEVALQVRRAIPNEGFVIWVQRPGDAPLLAHSSLETGTDPSGGALTSAALQALSEGRVISVDLDGARIVAAPMNPGGHFSGAMALFSRALTSRQDQEEGDRVLATLAAQTGAALDRVDLVHQVGHKHRLEAIGEVATGIAHELRNPLFGISAAAQLLQFRAREDAVVERIVGRILKEVERLNRMVTSLLDFGRPKRVTFTTGNPEEIWDEVLESQRPLLDARGLRLVHERLSVPVAVHLEAEQLSQVFLNLLVNAADHAPPGTPLRLRTYLQGTSWTCELNNQGPTIPPDVLGKVFQMFYSTKEKGTGIGLAICQRIIEEHEGTIAIASNPESGTTLTVTLPVLSPGGATG
ncbi:MAG: PAS domain-containing protein [Gemmatimonadetes bacterium]|nr:PAS domain-containing protein [Gemmatimonadota bacterium]